MFKFRKKEVMLTLRVVAALVAAIITAIVYISHKDSIVIRQPVFFSQMGMEEVYTGKTTLTYENKEMYLSNNQASGRTALMGVPVYMQNQEKLVLTQVMSYTDPGTNYIRKMNYFATVTRDGEICTLSVDGKKKHDVKGGYLFDGKNTYIFLEPMTVTVGDKSVELEALSYVTVANKHYLYYYSAEDKTSDYMVLDKEKIEARNSQDTYMLDLGYDLLEPSNGKTQMLIPNPEVLNLIQ